MSCMHRCFSRHYNQLPPLFKHYICCSGQKVFGNTVSQTAAGVHGARCYNHSICLKGTTGNSRPYIMHIVNFVCHQSNILQSSITLVLYYSQSAVRYNHMNLMACIFQHLDKLQSIDTATGSGNSHYYFHGLASLIFFLYICRISPADYGPITSPQRHFEYD